MNDKTKFKFTQGPWIVKDGHVYAEDFMNPRTYTDDAGVEHTYLGGLIALVYAPFDESCIYDRYGNTTLIAAAPDMFRALEAAGMELKNLGYSTDDVDAALNKARGMS